MCTLFKQLGIGRDGDTPPRRAIPKTLLPIHHREVTCYYLILFLFHIGAHVLTEAGCVHRLWLLIGQRGKVFSTNVTPPS